MLISDSIRDNIIRRSAEKFVKGNSSDNLRDMNVMNNEKVNNSFSESGDDFAEDGNRLVKLDAETNHRPFRLTKVVRGQIDRPMLVIILFFLVCGSAMVYSASYAYALSKYGDSAHFIRNQILYAALGLAFMIVVSLLDYKLIKKFTPAVFAVSIFLLLIVLVIGTNDGVAKRWIDLKVVTFQPSEAAKISVVLMLAYYYDKYYRQIHEKKHYIKTTILGTFIPGIILLFVCVLVFLENHVSGTVIIGLIGLSVIWAGGGKKLWYIIFGIAAVVGIVMLFMFTDKVISFLPDYAQKRINMWLHPENFDAQSDTWQTLQGLIAVGSGGLFGRGFGQSLQKQLFVSQPQNDFIFAIICEELGFVGALCIISLYLAFIWRGLYIARRAPDTFSAITAVGITAHVGIQAFLNMMVVTAVLPNTGITLPFFSYGGSSLVILMGEMGILLSISRYSRISK